MQEYQNVAASSFRLMIGHVELTNIEMVQLKRDVLLISVFERLNVNFKISFANLGHPKLQLLGLFNVLGQMF